MKKLLILVLVVISCQAPENKIEQNTEVAKLSLNQANRLAELPLACVNTEYPNKLGQTLGSEEDLGEPSELHPAFFGCFDWHSSVHGHWSLVKLLKDFPDLDSARQIKQILRESITEENITIEVEYFGGEYNKNYERTYGWAWLLKLALELETWEDPLGAELSSNLKPLTDLIVSRYLEFLPKLIYPIRVGEHPNTAFGLTFAWDYAVASENDELKEMIEIKAREFYYSDANCPLNWEPGGFDFLSPCLEEIDLMRRVLDRKDFLEWLDMFLPALKTKQFDLEVAKVSDRTDGKLVHLDGLNFSRAWVLYGLSREFSELQHLKKIADRHLNYSLPNLVGDSYEGGHWLGSFAIYAMDQQN